MEDDQDRNLRLQFHTVNPPEFEKLAGNAEAFRSIKEINEAYERARTEFTHFVERNRSQMIDEQIQKITLERDRLEPGLEPDFPKQPITDAARERVNGYILTEFKRLEADRDERRAEITQSVQDTRAQRQPAQTKTIAHPLSKDTHRTVDKTWDRLHGAFNHFLDQAGIDQASPQAEVFRARLDTEGRQHHRDIGKVFNEHGITRQLSQDRDGPTQT